MERPFQAYEGDEPYVFVCYSHEDRALVYPEITRLKETGIRIWYDEGIAPGSEWSDMLASRIEACAAFLYFVTSRSVISERCRREVNYALEQPCGMLAVHLEPTELPSGLKLTLSNRQAILKYDEPQDVYETRLSHAIWDAQRRDMQEAPSTNTLAIGEWTLDVGAQRLSRGNQSHRLDPKAQSVLLHLIDRAPEVVSREGLMNRTWPDVVVGQNVLDQAIAQLRKAFGDDSRNPVYIETLPRRGYRLVASVDSIDLPIASAASQRSGPPAARPRCGPGASSPGPVVEPGGTSNTQARAHYVLGKELWNVDPERALRELEQAVEIDPEFALAWVYVALAYGSMSRDPALTEAALARMSMATARAVTVAPDLWQAHDALGGYLMTRRDFVGADRAYRKSVELAEAADTVAHPGYTQYLMMVGRHFERQAVLDSIRQIDPLFPVADNLFAIGRREEGMAELERARGARAFIGGVQWWKLVDTELAIERGDAEELDRLLFAGTDLEGLWGTEAFLQVLRGKLDSNAEARRNVFSNYAKYAARHGDVELALALLRREYLRDGFGGHATIWYSVLGDVRASDGFKEFLRDYGIVEMFRSTGKWNDYCRPIGSGDFECH
ncbi:MAG: TIR domain-containing protein [Pseudomonadales bacterium]